MDARLVKYKERRRRYTSLPPIQLKATLAGRSGGRIRHPRHFLLYRVTESNLVEIGRVLHDSIELQAHLPEEYRLSGE